MELDPTSIIVRVLPCRVALRELMTASEGIIALLAGWPIVFWAGAEIASWADAACGAATSAVSPAHRPTMAFLMAFPSLPLDLYHMRAARHRVRTKAARSPPTVFPFLKRPPQARADIAQCSAPETVINEVT